MDEVDAIFAERSRVSDIAREMRAPVGTVWEWKKARAIPPWRRPAVLVAIQRLELELPPEVFAYLAQDA